MNERDGRGGKRAGAGRPPIMAERLVRATVSLTKAQIERLKRLGDGNISAGVRRLLERTTDKD